MRFLSSISRSLRGVKSCAMIFYVRFRFLKTDRMVWMHSVTQLSLI